MHLSNLVEETFLHREKIQQRNQKPQKRREKPQQKSDLGEKILASDSALKSEKSFAKLAGKENLKLGGKKSNQKGKLKKELEQKETPFSDTNSCKND